MNAQGNNDAFEGLISLVRSGLDVFDHSGKVTPGSIFVAVPGVGVDGARFIPQALQNGAGYVVARPGTELPKGAAASLVAHDDPRIALGLLAAARYGAAEQGLKLAGVTGTNGKTTITYILEHLLASAGKKAGVMGTIEYRWPGFSQVSNLTTPGCLKVHELLAAMAGDGVETAVMEVSSHAISQNRVLGLSFDAAIFTNLTQDHLDYHKDMEEYFQVKSKLFGQYLKMQSGAVINFDDPFGARLLSDLPEAIGFGLGDSGGRKKVLQGRILANSGKGIELETSFQGETWRIASPMIGRHNASNLLAAQGAALVLGLAPSDMQSLSGFAGAPGRLERVRNERGLDIFVDYAHTPDALENVLRAIRELEIGRLLTVFGCGGDRDRAKRPLMAEAVAEYADLAVLTSDNPRHEKPEDIMADAAAGLSGAKRSILEPDRKKAIAAAISEMKKGDVLVVAGKGHENYQQIGDEKFPFSDAAVVREILACS